MTAAAGSLVVREDALLDGRVRLLQPVHGYRVAIDPVLLAAAVPLRDGERVLELGCGVGAAALCLLARHPEAAVVGLELQPGLARLAGGNAALNGRADAFRPLAADILQPPLRPGLRFDHVIANPPHLRPEAARRSGNAGRDLANVEGRARLSDWVAAALAWLRPRGTLTMLHRADRLDDVLACLSHWTGGIVVAPLWPAPGRDARRVVVQARPGVQTPTRLAPGLVLHAPGGGFTQEAEAILRGGAAWLV